MTLLIVIFIICKLIKVSLLFYRKVVLEAGVLMAIMNFGNKIADDIFHNSESKQLPRELWIRARQLLFLMDAVDHVKALETAAHPPSIRAHSLRGNRKGQTAIDITKTSGWRITFIFGNGVFKDVKIENYHK